MNVMLLLIMMLFGVLPCLILGYLIRFKKKYGLIAGYESSQVNNAELLAKRIANLLFITAGLMAALYIDIELSKGISNIGWLIIISLLIVPCVLAFRAQLLDKRLSESAKKKSAGH